MFSTSQKLIVLFMLCLAATTEKVHVKCKADSTCQQGFSVGYTHDDQTVQVCLDSVNVTTSDCEAFEKEVYISKCQTNHEGKECSPSICLVPGEEEKCTDFPLNLCPDLSFQAVCGQCEQNKCESDKCFSFQGMEVCSPNSECLVQGYEKQIGDCTQGKDSAGKECSCCEKMIPKQVKAQCTSDFPFYDNQEFVEFAKDFQENNWQQAYLKSWATVAVGLMYMILI